MIRTALCIAMLGLACNSFAATARTDHAGIFDTPTAADQAAERERCYRSKLCRALIGQLPPVLYTALNGNKVCIEHALEAAHRLEGVKGVDRMRVVIGSKDLPGTQELHAVLVVTFEGHDYVIDQGGLSTHRAALGMTCQTAGECSMQAVSRREQAVCPEGVCEARDGLHGFVAMHEPIKVWPEREGLALAGVQSH